MMNTLENLKPSENPRKKCSDCGLPEDRIHLCDRWSCGKSPTALPNRYEGSQVRNIYLIPTMGSIGED